MKSVINLGLLALRTKLPKEWLQGAADCGQIPCLKVGKRYLFNPEAVESALAELAASSRAGTKGGPNNAA